VTEAKTKLAKTIVVYESKYGNTKTAAERIAQGLRTGKGVDVETRELKGVDLKRIPDYDVIVIGSPNHFGGPTRGIRKFIDQLGKLDLKKKLVATFDTYISKDFEKAVKKMEKSLTEKAPGLKIASPGLSIKVQGVGASKGPIVEGELDKCEEFGKRIAAKIS
jgi:flavorubredoxin